MFSSLKIKNFRLYWFGMLISLIGTWIQTVAQSWLVFQLTKSALLLGVVGFLSMIPVFIFSLFGGVVADRFNKRNILLVTQNIFMVLAFVLAALTHLKLISPLQIMLIAFANGLVMAFDGPCRQAVVAELVGKQHLLNAIALNSAAFNSARIIGPALAGVLIAGIGMSGCFYVNGISFLAVIIALLLIRVENKTRRSTESHFLKDLAEGLHFIKTNRTLLVLIAIVGVVSFFGISYVILMPVFANDVLNLDARGFGALISFAGIGAVVAALMLAALGDFKYKGKLLIFANLVFCISLMAFSMARNFFSAVLALVFVGWASVMVVSIVNTLLQILVPDHFRGRIMSAFMLTFAGVMPLGNLLAGSLAHYFGVTLTIFLSAIVCGVFFLLIGIFDPELRNL